LPLGEVFSTYEALLAQDKVNAAALFLDDNRDIAGVVAMPTLKAMALLKAQRVLPVIYFTMHESTPCFGFGMSPSRGRFQLVTETYQSGYFPYTYRDIVHLEGAHNMAYHDVVGGKRQLLTRDVVTSVQRIDVDGCAAAQRHLLAAFATILSTKDVVDYDPYDMDNGTYFDDDSDASDNDDDGYQVGDLVAGETEHSRPYGADAKDRIEDMRQFVVEDAKALDKSGGATDPDAGSNRRSRTSTFTPDSLRWGDTVFVGAEYDATRGVWDLAFNAPGLQVSRWHHRNRDEPSDARYFYETGLDYDVDSQWLLFKQNRSKRHKRVVQASQLHMIRALRSQLLHWRAGAVGETAAAVAAFEGSMERVRTYCAAVDVAVKFIDKSVRAMTVATNRATNRAAAAAAAATRTATRTATRAASVRASS
jgi:hypothetical protein